MCSWSCGLWCRGTVRLLILTELKITFILSFTLWAYTINGQWIGGRQITPTRQTQTHTPVLVAGICWEIRHANQYTTHLSWSCLLSYTPARAILLLPFVCLCQGNVPWIFICVTNICFNYTYYTVAHKCNIRQLFAIPASYENKHRPSKTGRSLCACLNASCFSAAFFFLGLVPLCSWVFVLFLLFDRVLLSACLLMLTFSSKGKACLKRLGGKARVKKISSLPGESPSLSLSTLCLGSDLLSTSPYIICVTNISRIPEQNGVSEAQYIVEIRHSGPEPLICMCNQSCSAHYLSGCLSIWPISHLAHQRLMLDILPNYFHQIISYLLCF